MPNLGSFFTPPDPDPWPENIPDPHGSGSETLFADTDSDNHGFNVHKCDPLSLDQISSVGWSAYWVSS